MDCQKDENEVVIEAVREKCGHNVRVVGWDWKVAPPWVQATVYGKLPEVVTALVEDGYHPQIVTRTVEVSILGWYGANPSTETV